MIAMLAVRPMCWPLRRPCGEEVWSAMRAAKVARFPGAAGRIPNFTGAEAAAERLRAMPAWQAAGDPEGQPGLRAVAGTPARA